MDGWIGRYGSCHCVSVCRFVRFPYVGRSWVTLAASGPYFGVPTWTDDVGIWEIRNNQNRCWEWVKTRELQRKTNQISGPLPIVHWLRQKKYRNFHRWWSETCLWLIIMILAETAISKLVGFQANPTMEFPFNYISMTLNNHSRQVMRRASRKKPRRANWSRASRWRWGRWGRWLELVSSMDCNIRCTTI